MKHFQKLLCGLFITTGLAGQPDRGVAQSDEEIIEAARSVIKADRQAVVATAMQFTDDEGQAFWPLYHRYRAEMDQVGDDLKKMVLEYAQLYPDVPDDRAKSMLKNLVALEKKQTFTRAAYLNKFSKVLPATKTLRFAQVESRLDLAVRLELAANIPLVPVEGGIIGERAVGVATAQGRAGGIVVETFELRATVTAIDAPNRKVTLLDKGGIKQTVKAGPEAINFDQIRVGDELDLVATEELVVQMGDKAAAADDGSARAVALAPKGAKPGGLMAETRQVTGTVTAIDQNKRTARLKFEDGATRTFPVRNDVDLGKRKVGDKVVFRVTESLAISVKKP